VKDGARYVARHRLPPCEPLPPRASACRATTPPPRRPSPPRPSLPLPRLGHRLRRRPRRRPRRRRPRRRRPRRRPRPPPSPPPSPGASLLAATSLAARAASLAPSFSVRACRACAMRCVRFKSSPVCTPTCAGGAACRIGIKFHLTHEPQIGASCGRQALPLILSHGTVYAIS
jgi:hypothetical protein